VFVVGLAAALVASVLFNVGIALQGIEARSAPPELGLRWSLLARLIRRPRWVIGWLLGIVGIGPQVIALAEAPFVVVQPALAVGLLILLWLGVRTFGEPVEASEVFGVVAIIVGIGLITWGAPGRTEAHRGVYAALAVVGAMCLAGVLPLAVKGTRFDTGMLAIVASGCGFGASNIATKLMADEWSGSHLVAAGAWAITAIAIGIVATLTTMTAFQRRRATTVVPVSTALQTFLPILLEPFFLREDWSAATYDGAPILAGLLIMFLGTILVSRAPAVGKLAAGAQAAGQSKGD
jgi:drug/metabolite transporter (DMT)-like permease